MAKSKKLIDESVAGDLGLVLTTHSTTIREIAECPDRVQCLLFAYEQDDYVYYDLLPLWREIDGMRIKMPKFQTHPTIVDRLNKRFYKRYYVAGNGELTRIKVDKPIEFERRLPFESGNINDCLTYMVNPIDGMGLRKKHLLFHREKIQYGYL